MNEAWRKKVFTAYTPFEAWLEMWSNIGMYHFFRGCNGKIPETTPNGLKIRRSK